MSYIFSFGRCNHTKDESILLITDGNELLLIFFSSKEVEVTLMFLI